MQSVIHLFVGDVSASEKVVYMDHQGLVSPRFSVSLLLLLDNIFCLRRGKPQQSLLVTG
jgi:hypothetical protein